jgi:hypothetical protein
MTVPSRLTSWPSSSSSRPATRSREDADLVPVGFRIKLQPGMIHTATLRTGHPARLTGERLATGPFGAIVGKLGMRAAVGMPIVVGEGNGA